MPVGTRSSVLRSEEPIERSSHIQTDQDEQEYQDQEEDMANDITQTLSEMQQTLTTLMSKMTALENGRVESEATRNNREQSAFSDQGKTFVPKGIAAKAVFKKYPGGEMKNPDHCDKAKARARDPELFTGDASKFDS
ncbi:hypothetical protein E4U46_005095 [Claviceps purpurea]|nr:hypothetical protein E4U46_005095 [Claviceps purpurea]